MIIDQYSRRIEASTKELKRFNISIKPVKMIFYVVFFLVFCLSGIITMLHIIPYRMGLVSALVIPLILLCGVRFDRILISYLLLALVIGVSALLNESSLLEFLLFLRVLVFSYLTYYLVQVFVHRDNIVNVIRLIIAVAMVQLPIIILQKLTYDKLPSRLTVDIIYFDFDFGTFNYKGDASLGFFLILIIIFLLFEHKRNYIVPFRGFVLFWLTFTVLMIHSNMVKLIILLIWGVYLISKLNPIRVISFALVFFLALGVLRVSGFYEELLQDFTKNTTGITLDVSTKQKNQYLSGDYSRAGAVSYYLNQNILWFGDGPSKYSDVFTRERVRGNVGHIFTFYSEVGLLGWFLSMVIFFLIAFPEITFHVYKGRFKARFRISWMNTLMFISIAMLSFTTQVMNDISVFLIFCVMSKIHLIDPLKHSGGVIADKTQSTSINKVGCISLLPRRQSVTR